MKPINLKIKGLNSFTDSQEINFEKLTDKGLFGIFGPTGSGKSTILDGITLALYGEVARKSTNFMNTNCDALNVSYEFQISEKEIKRYRVDREFRRDKKTDSVRSKSAKIVIVSEDNETVLEEGAKTVTEKCEEIIGLKLEDFTRTVVLPQGKFSEFLKLEGKERRNMLERLFNLQKYGDDLSMKLSRKIKDERDVANNLDGQLKVYEEFSDETLAEKTTELSETKEKYSKCQLELKDAEENFSKGKELWDFQNELKEQTNKELELRKREKEITESERKVILGESILKVTPYIESYNTTLKQYKDANKELSDLTAAAEIIKVKKEKAEAVLESASNKKNNELPDLKIRGQRVQDAIEEKNILNGLMKVKRELEISILKLEENLLVTAAKTEKNQEAINAMNNSINVREEKAETLKIPEVHKKKVQDAILILNTYESQVKQKNTLSKDIETISSNIQATAVKSETLTKDLHENEKQINSSKGALTKLIETCPGDHDTLINLQLKLSVTKEKWDKHKLYNESLQKEIGIIETLRKESGDKEIEKASLEKEINELNDKLKKLETENLAHTLREALRDGEICPVCGSMEHHLENFEIINSGNLEELRLDLTNMNDIYNTLSKEIITAQTNIQMYEKNIKEYQEYLDGLGEDYKEFSAEALQEEFDNLKAEVSKYNNDKTEIEDKIKNLTESKSRLDIEYSKAVTIISENKERLEKLQNDKNAVSEECEKLNKKLSELKAELGVEDFKSRNQEIIEMEKQKTALEKEIKQLRDQLKTAQELKEKLNNESASFREELNGKKTSLIEKNKNIEEKEQSIRTKAGDAEDLENLKAQISAVIVKIEEEYAAAEKTKNEIEKQFNDCNANIVSTRDKLLNLKERGISDREKLDKALAEEGIKDINEAQENYIPKSEIDELKSKIQEYKDSLARLAGTIENLKKKIGGRNLAEEEWLEIQNAKDEKTKILKELEENKIKLEAAVKSIKDKLEEKKKLLKKKEELDYKLSLLDDLEKLFKGKRFVEFVAANQLKYVSVEACRKLKEITGGNYGLEVDENGKFLIRDYKNGGAQRDATTLSGGETFLASLALALALSAQIQLKGTAPLELFFLDEGFGTLDDTLLEVVMDSLEKIHHEKLSIGIISHVESIKNRVPVKLMITPAEAGMGGSKVKIERS
ncbi:MAG: AAA family ATPase [Clostridiaceae bacterium]